MTPTDGRPPFDSGVHVGLGPYVLDEIPYFLHLVLVSDKDGILGLDHNKVFHPDSGNKTALRTNEAVLCFDGLYITLDGIPLIVLLTDLPK